MIGLAVGALGSAVLGWVVQRAGDGLLVGQIVKRLHRKRFAEHIEITLRADAALCKRCVSPPQVVRSNLTEAAVVQIVRTAASQDTNALAQMLVKQRVVLLPGVALAQADLLPVVSAVASCLIDEITTVIAGAPDLQTQFTVYCTQHLAGKSETILRALNDHTLKLGIVQASLDGLHLKLDSIAEKVSDATSASEARVTPPQVGTAMQVQALAEQLTEANAQLRAALDEEGKRLWDDNQREWRLLNLDAAVNASLRLEEWVNGRGGKASGTTRGRLYLTLADLAVLSEYRDKGTRASVPGRARELVRLAGDAFGTEIGDDDASRLASVRSKLDALSGDVENALKRLDGCDHPACISRTLDILIDRHRWEEAGAVLQRVPLHERWCDLAVSVRIARGEMDAARDAVDWAKRECPLVTQQRCAAAFGRACVARLFETHKERSHLTPDQLPEAERNSLRLAQDVLAPFLTAIEAIGAASSGVEGGLVESALTISYLLADAAQSQRLAPLLAKQSPVSLEFAGAVLRGVAPAPDDLPTRLRKEHPRRYDALLLAALVESEKLGRHREALQTALTIPAECEIDDDHKEDFCDSLHDLAVAAGEPPTRDALKVAERLLGSDHLVLKMWGAEAFLVRDDIEKAESAINALSNPSDPRWLQLSARLLEAKGEIARAAEVRSEAAQLVPNQFLLGRAAESALRASLWSLAEASLKRLVLVRPNEPRIWAMLARARASLADYEGTAACFIRLQALEPQSPLHPYNAAVAKALAGHTEESLRILTESASTGSPTAELAAARAQFLLRLGQPVAAFAELDSGRDRHWDDAVFVSSYLGTAYAAQRDDKAHEALVQLVEMRKAGKVSQDTLHEATIEDVVAMGRAGKEHRQKRAEDLLRGSVPWVMVDHVRRIPTYTAWRGRTHGPRRDDSLGGRAFETVYATHAFTVVPPKDERGHLIQIGCPPRGTEVVADITALITLQRLDLLETAVDFFGRLHVPSSYAEMMLEQRAGFLHPQPSQLQAQQTVLGALNAGTLKRDDGAAGTLRLSEYADDADEGENPVRPLELLDLLHRDGKITDSELTSAKQHLNKRGRALADNDVESGFLADFETLQAIYQAGLLDRVTEYARVHLLRADEQRLRAEIAEAEGREESARWHVELMERIATDARFVRVSDETLFQHTDDSDRDPQYLFGVSALWIAQQQRVPLLADDRWCQVNHLVSGTTETYAFGTDAFLAAATEDSALSLSDAADHWLQLLEWRYRFLILPSDVLHHLATRNRARATIPPLRFIARYIHDCMRDPGLLAGPEKADPPFSMALKLHIEWSRTIAQFLLKVWLDREFTDDAARAVTDWAASEMLPSPPATLSGDWQLRAAAKQPAMTLNAAMFASVMAKDWKRANECIRAIAIAMGLSGAEVARAVEETVYAAGDVGRSRGG